MISEIKRKVREMCNHKLSSPRAGCWQQTLSLEHSLPTVNNQHNSTRPETDCISVRAEAHIVFAKVCHFLPFLHHQASDQRCYVRAFSPNHLLKPSPAGLHWPSLLRFTIYCIPRCSTSPEPAFSPNMILGQISTSSLGTTRQECTEEVEVQIQ